MDNSPLENGDRLNRYEFERRFYLEKGEYLDLSVDTDGIIRSRVFPGLWLVVAELLAGNMQHVLAVLQEGVQSPEHAAFVQKLASD